MSDLYARFDRFVVDHRLPASAVAELRSLLGDAQASEASLVQRERDWPEIVAAKRAAWLADNAPRPDWDEYFLGIAKAVAARGECVRSKVGAVIVVNRRIVATGYNGVEAGALSCLDGVCPRGLSGVPSDHPYYGAGACIAIHAEDNALRDARRRGLSVEGGTIYVSKEPCAGCARLIKDSPLGRAVWP